MSTYTPVVMSQSGSTVMSVIAVKLQHHYIDELYSQATTNRETPASPENFFHLLPKNCNPKFRQITAHFSHPRILGNRKSRHLFSAANSNGAKEGTAQNHTREQNGISKLRRPVLVFDLNNFMHILLGSDFFSLLFINNTTMAARTSAWTDVVVVSSPSGKKKMKHYRSLLTLEKLAHKS